MRTVKCAEWPKAAGHQGSSICLNSYIDHRPGSLWWRAGAIHFPSNLPIHPLLLQECKSLLFDTLRLILGEEIHQTVALLFARPCKWFQDCGQFTQIRLRSVTAGCKTTTNSNRLITRLRVDSFRLISIIFNLYQQRKKGGQSVACLGAALAEVLAGSPANVCFPLMRHFKLEELECRSCRGWIIFYVFRHCEGRCAV